MPEHDASFDVSVMFPRKSQAVRLLHSAFNTEASSFKGECTFFVLFLFFFYRKVRWRLCSPDSLMAVF